jgi:20S proteasome alpha/beta subunit
MTIAVGFLCNNGNDLIIASDRQFTVEGFSKRFAKKLVSDGPELLYGFAGDPGLYAEARQKISGFLATLKPAEWSVDVIRETIESVLNQMLLRGADSSYKPLYLFVGFNEIFERPRLFVFNGQAVYESEGGVEIIGCGDTSLIHFLEEHLYSRNLPPEQGIALAGYLIKKATQHVDKTGGQIDVARADGLGFEPVSKDDVEKGINKIEEQEQYLSTLLIQKPFQLS